MGRTRNSRNTRKKVDARCVDIKIQPVKHSKLVDTSLHGSNGFMCFKCFVLIKSEDMQNSLTPKAFNSLNSKTLAYTEKS